MAVLNNSVSDTVIIGSTDLDSIYNDGAKVTIYGADNFSDVVENHGDSAIISLQGGNDVVTNSGKYAVIYGGANDDSIVNSGNSALILGVSGNNTIRNSGENSVLIGSENGNNVIISEVGATIMGGTGNNTLTGGEGENYFIHREGANDTITSYNQAYDIISLAKGKVAESLTSDESDDVILKIADDDGNSLGTITVQDAKGKYITVYDEEYSTRCQETYLEFAQAYAQAFVKTVEEDEDFQSILTNGENSAVLSDIKEIDPELAKDIADYCKQVYELGKAYVEYTSESSSSDLAYDVGNEVLSEEETAAGIVANWSSTLGFAANLMENLSKSPQALKTLGEVAGKRFAILEFATNLLNAVSYGHMVKAKNEVAWIEHGRLGDGNLWQKWSAIRDENKGLFDKRFKSRVATVFSAAGLIAGIALTGPAAIVVGGACIIAPAVINFAYDKWITPKFDETADDLNNKFRPNFEEAVGERANRWLEAIATGEDYYADNDKDNTILYGTSGNDILTNTGNGVLIAAGSGNDNIYNWGNDVVIAVGSGNDYIVNYSIDNIRIDLGDGYKQISDTYGGSFADRYPLVGVIGVNVTGANGQYYITESKNAIVGNGNNTIRATGTVIAGDGDNKILAYGNIIAGKGNNTIQAAGDVSRGDGNVTVGVGNNSIMAGGHVTAGDGNNTISTGIGNITVGNGDNHVGTNGNVTAGDGNNFIGADGTVTAGNGNNYITGTVVHVGDGDNDIYANHVTAGNGNNTISGDSGTIKTGSGDDFISGYGGNINAGDGVNTIIIYDSGTIQAGSGDDFISLTGSENYVDASDGKNTVSGGYSSTIKTGSGDDLLIDIGSSSIDAGEGNNTISGGSGTIQTGSGDDLLVSVCGSIDVGEGNDTVIIGPYGSVSGYYTSYINAVEGKKFISLGGGDNHTITTGADSDTIVGNVYEALINAGDGVNIINLYISENASWNSSTVTTGKDNDTIEVEGGWNSIDVGEGNNFISISFGDNTIQTGKGKDTIIVDAGANSIIAGNGKNFIDIAADENGYGDGRNTITTGADADTILVSGSYNLIDAGDSDNYVVLSSYIHENGGFYGGQNTVTSGVGNDTIEVEGGWNSIDAGEGNNFINISGTIGGYSTISAGSGNDIITVSFQGGNSIDAGDGDNLVELFGYSTVSAGTGNDTVRIIGNSSKNIDVGDGDNYVIIDENTLDENPSAGTNTVTSGEGNDTIIIANSWANSIEAGDGDNYVSISGDHSTVITGEGNDTIINTNDGFYNAGKGKNLIVLNASNGLSNTISVGAGDDTIHGLNWLDVISLEGRYTTLISGNDFYIQNNGHTILLTEIDKVNFAPNIQGGICAGTSSSDVTVPSDETDIPAGAWAVVHSANGTQNAVYSDTIANGTNFDDTIKVAALTSGNSRVINGNGGNDSVYIYGVEQDWSDAIDNFSNVTINGGAGQDTVNIYGNNFAIRDATVLIDGGADDDYIHTTGKENNVAIFNSAVTLSGGTGNDTIEVGNKINAGAVAVYAQFSLKIYGGEGDDKVTVNGGIQESAATIDGGTGNNEFNFINGQYNPFYSVTSGVIFGGDGDDTVNFYSGGNNGILCSTLNVDVGNGNNLVSVKANDNAIVNSTFTIKSGAGTDTINLNGNTYHGISQSTGTINTGAGNDILNITTDSYSGIYQATVSIDVADGDDILSIYGKGSTGINQSEVKINGGNDNDEINIVGDSGIYYSTVTASGGAGADTINVKAESADGSMYSRYLLDGGDEADYINISGNTGIGGGSTMTATGGSGNDTINVSGTNYGIGGSYDSLDGGDGNDLISIIADSINGVDYSEVTFNGGIGNDTININAGRFAIAASTVSIDGGAGKDLIHLSGDSLGIGYEISYDYDSDTQTWSTIKGDSSNVTINGGADADTIFVNSIDDDAEVLIYAGAGDNISVGSGEADYLFDSSDAVTINGATFKASAANTSAGIQTSDTAITLGSKWSGTVELKENYTLTDFGGSVIKSAGLYNVVDGKITLSSGEDTWKINGTTATYGTEDKVLITITGLKNDATADGISLSGKVVTLKASVLGTDEVTLTGDGYSLALAEDVEKVKEVAATWSVTNGTAEYKGGKTAGYTLSGNKVTYSQAVDSETLATITGLKADATAEGISISDKVITLSESVLGIDEVALTGDGYTLALAEDVERPTAVTASWKVSEGTAIYRGSTTAGYVLDDNKIIYQAASDDETIMTVTGLNVNATDSDISLNDGILNLSASAIGNDTITIEKTVDVSKITAGKAGNFLISSQTFKTDTPVDFIINADGNVSAVELTNIESTTFTNSADNISILGGTGNDVITNSGSNVTVSGNFGNDTISNSGNNAVFQYTKGDGDDVIVGFTENDVLKISDDMYNTTVAGNDLQVNLVRSHNKIILKDGANLTPNIEGTWNYGFEDKDGKIIENPVAQIEIDGETYYYESVARATNDAENNSIVTVIADSTETAQFNSTKNLTIQFAERGLGVYSVTGGNFVSADSSQSAQFSISSSRVLSNSNSLLINNGATATVDGYKVTGTSNGYTFALQENSFTLNNVSYNGAGNATFDTSGNVSLTSGAIANTTETATINLAAGSYTINGVEFSVATNNKAVTTADGVKFNLSSDTVTYNAMTFSGGSATFSTDEIILTGGAIVSSVEADQAFTFIGTGTFKLDNKTVVNSAPSLTVTNTAEGLTVGENTFSVTDEEFTLNVDANGKIVSASGIKGGSTIINSGGAASILTSSEGNFTFGEKTFAISGDDSVTFGLSSDGTVTKIADITGTVSGDFTNAININGNAADVQVTGDDSINVTASNIFGVSNNASIIGTGGASVVSTDEEGTFNFYENQNFTVSGDNSVDFNVNNSVVTGIANFENGTLQVDNTSPIYINGEYITPNFTDTATFIIADSKVISVEGVTAIEGLSNATVHATGATTINSANVNVSGDSDFNVIVMDTKTTELSNISAGASVSVNNFNVTTDENGTFKVGENLYTVNDADNSVTFMTGSNGAVSNVTNFSGTLQTNSRSVTVNGAALTTNDTEVTISSAGTGISRIDGVKSGDVLSGDIDAAAVMVTVTSADDVALWRLNSKTYMLTGDSDGVSVTGNRIDGLDSAASLEVGAAGNYIVNGTRLDAKNLDTIIGTAEGSAYIFDPNNVPLNVETMTDDEIAAQVGISTEFSTAETDTDKAAALIADTSKLDGNMELALSNSDTTTAQTADFSESTGKKKVTLTEGAQEIKFNDEGGNVAVIDSDSDGEKNITLGNGGDLAIVKGTSTPVNITAGKGADTIVTSGNNVTVDMTGGATKIVANSGNVNLTNYDASTGAGIQIDEVSDIERAVQNGNINFENGAVSFGDATVKLNADDAESTTVNLYDNRGRKQKVAYTHNDGGTIDTTNSRENVLLVGNNNSTKSGSRLTAGSGNDIAFGGVGDYFDLGAGNNRVYLNETGGATVAMTATSGKTEVSGFSSGFSENADKVSINILGATVSFKNGQLTFSLGAASLILNFTGSSADLIDDNNFIGNDTQLDEITPITYEQSEYQNIYGENDSIKGSVQITLTDA